MALHAHKVRYENGKERVCTLPCKLFAKQFGLLWLIAIESTESRKREGMVHSSRHLRYAIIELLTQAVNFLCVLSVRKLVLWKAIVDGNSAIRIEVPAAENKSKRLCTFTKRYVLAIVKI